MRWPLQEARVMIVIKNAVTDGTAKMSSPQSSWVAGSDEGKSLPKLHVGERFLLRQFRAHSVPQAYRRNCKELDGGTHHANLRQDRCDSWSCRRNRSRQRGSSRSLVWLLFSSVLPS